MIRELGADIWNGAVVTSEDGVFSTRRVYVALMNIGDIHCSVVRRMLNVHSSTIEAYFYQSIGSVQH